MHDIEEERIRSEHNLNNITKAHEKINQEEKVSPYYQVWLIHHDALQHVTQFTNGIFPSFCRFSDMSSSRFVFIMFYGMI